MYAPASFILLGFAAGDNHPFSSGDYHRQTFFLIFFAAIIGVNHLMPSARKKGTKLAGAYIEDAKDEALAELAKANGYSDKAAFIRALFDAALEGQLPKSKSSGKRAKPKSAE